ncbi:unnamed protein product [Periconia digitata]|uniref:Uncharacterized protein n=1 Tax=Periconia digitata TaxID=1303443 RepID=A0A9W4XRJ1_9PLEO|nr:unnamed protein product [Periconia digitata]
MVSFNLELGNCTSRRFENALKCTKQQLPEEITQNKDCHRPTNIWIRRKEQRVKRISQQSGASHSGTLEIAVPHLPG